MEKKHHYLRIAGRKLHCVTEGEGPAVLLLPGWPQTWFAWRDVMTTLAQQGFTTVAIDPPGTGESEAPAGGYDTGNIAAVAHQLMTQLGHTRYQAIGHDIGMWVGYALAADFPEAIERLILTEAVIPGLAPAPSIFVDPQENIFLWHFMFNQLADLPEALTTGRERAYLSFIFDKWSWQRHRVAADIYIQAYSEPGRLQAGFSYYRAIPETVRQNQRRALTPLPMPVLAIGAEHATRDAPYLTMQPVAPYLQNAMVENCGHFITEECPEAFCHLALPFLQGITHAAE
ncbi:MULTISPECIES: alpha/beta fold hydrolase [Erwinia]|uniref:alpha/beta fold hydrolase n=1 Tax=Erwinia TaxID=551 RepID=UPI00105CEC24|nr:alpha/beta hydrolase [Erwinia rhapontici]MBP2157294.1 pimeloyl-ACP methyl ester carboxylesterase [Erwinia rhapontici]NKG29394.1 alpha/beta hydrolase [Erwinia rhapontici]TDS90453.1 pimeloyl-ACP methyl ester carboxylesterase [Erwinia rhapontici]